MNPQTQTVLEIDLNLDDEIEEMKAKAKLHRGRGCAEAASATNIPSTRIVKFKENVNRAKETQLVDLKPQRSVEGWILFVTGIHDETQEEDLHDLFSNYGPVKNLHLNLDRRTGFAKGYALVEFETFKEASDAITKVNGLKLYDQKLGVDWCFKSGSKKQPRVNK